MGTGFYLLDNENPRAPRRSDGRRFWGYPHTDTVKRVIVLHTAECDPSPGSAWNIARYFSRSDRAASYQTVVDVENTVPLIPPRGVSFNVRGFNSPSLGLSWATRAALWGRYPKWDEGALRRAAVQARDWVRRFGIPVRQISRQQALNGAKGFVTHAVMDPDRRSDPGTGFPLDRFFDLVRYGSKSEGDGMESLRRGHEGNEVRVLQWRINQVLHREADPDGGGLTVDGVFGDETEAYVKHVQARFGYDTSGVYDLPTAVRMFERLIQSGVIRERA